MADQLEQGEDELGLLDPAGLARWFGLFTEDGKPNVQAIYYARFRGECPPALLVANKLRWRRKDVADWLAARVEPAAKKAG